jgi:tRNA pseudouridine38-40 synthase
MDLPFDFIHIARGIYVRIALGVEYAGNHFHGWQSQTGAPCVQIFVEKALSAVANHPLTVTAAGRTDSGVHATAQVIHIDTTAQREMRSWVHGANANLPNGISLLWAKPVDESFHARFSAQARHYRYIIFNRCIRPSVFATKVTWEYRHLDSARMQESANYLIGEHDFTAFRAVACQAKNPVRTISRLNIVRIGEYVIIDVSANAFLYHMVRNIAGMLIAVGCGKKSPDWAKCVLESRNRKIAGKTAPASGLYLCGVDYPPHYDFPKMSMPFILE